MMKIVETIAARVNMRKVLKRAAIFLVVFSIVGFLVLPPIIKSVLLKKLSETLQREVAIQTVRFNPFMLSLTVRGLEVKEPKSQQKFASFDELYLNFQAMSLIRRGIIIKEILLKKPYVNVVRNEDLTFNFTDLLLMAEKKPEDKQKDAKASPLRFSLNNIQVTGANIDFMDGPKHTRHTVKDATLTVPFVSNLPYYLDSYVRPAFSAAVNGHPVAFKGNSKPFVDSHETSIDLNIKDLDLPYYLAYSPVPLKFKLGSGFLDTLSSITYVQYKDKNPTLSLNGRISFKQIRITDKADAPLASFPRIDISISSSDLMSLNVHFAKIDVQSPEIDVVLDNNGRPNLLALIPEQSAKPAGEEKNTANDEAPEPTALPKKPLPVIEVDEMLLSGGKVTFADLSEKRNFRTRLENIQAKVNRFSTMKDKKGNADVSFQTDTQEAFKLTSNFSVEPRAAEGTAEASRIALKKYLPYLEKFVNFTVEGGEINIQTKYLYQQTEKGPDVRVSDFAATLNSLRLRKTDEKKDFLNIPVATVKDLSADLTKREVVIGDVSTQKGTVLVKRYRVGTLLFSTLVKVSERLEPAVRQAPPQKKQAPPEKPWALTVKKLLLDRYTITYDDAMPVDPVVVTLEKVTVKGEDLSNIRKTKGKLAVNLRIGDKGFADARGSVTIEPPSASLKLTLRDIPVLALQSYFADLVKVIVTDGSISSKGTVVFTYAKDTGPGVKYKGEVSLNNFASVDKVEAEDFLKWDSLHVDAMDISYAPLVATIGEVALSDFYARVIINADGSINLQNIMEKKEAKVEGQTTETKKGPSEVPEGGMDVKSAAAPPETAKKLVKIEKVTLQGGTVNFSDRYIKPNFGTNMLEMGGRVTGLSSEETKMADVELRGKLENYAPLEVTGRINPLRDDLFIDLKISFKDMDLSPLTPYSGKYLGYAIEKGKLTLNLQYLIEKKKLDAQNKILLDQFTLGSQVDSPDATKLPVRLAIALLKNRRGEIDLDVPVSGQIDDPQFSLGRIILKILVNLLVKAATSPFALLGALFGGGEELSYVEFDPGIHDLNAQGIKKLDTLVKALNDRPALKLDIEGHADLEKDREGLKQYLFNRKVKAQKLKDLAKKGGETVSVDEI
ncbi:MAG: DUF748 domain-containing protein [Nitrospirae bacterium]|nr:DUF748 domain-containing protein [Nitrospirota bacterium]